MSNILRQLRIFFYLVVIYFLAVLTLSCNYVTHRTLSNEVVKEDEDPEPDYNITLNQDYQDFVTYIFMGNRSESFGAFFNKFYQAQEDYNAAMLDYRTSTIAAYNRRLDSLNITPPVSTTASDLFKKVIERCSKIIQYNKNTRFLDDAVLLIGKSYYYMGEYLQADRKFSEFLSKLTISPLSDEALLFLGRTRIKLGNTTDGEKILKNLLEKTTDLEIKSEICQELAFSSISKNDYKIAIDFFEQSIKYSKDKEKIAEKLYILAKIYSTFDAEKAHSEYLTVLDKTSDFDLTFYAKLNVAKSLIDLKNYDPAYELLIKMNHNYRDYPDYKQLVELEIANILFYQKKYATAKQHYFDIILNYAGTKCAADAYYHLGEYSEKVEKNYLESYVNFKKASETNTTSDYYNYSAKHSATLDKYFTLVSIIKDTTKINLPTENKELQKYKAKLEKEKGIEKQKTEEKQQQENKGNIPPPKGGGERPVKYPLDSLKSGNFDSTKILNGNLDTSNFIKQNIPDTNKLLKQNPIDTNKLIKQNLTDTTKLTNLKDSLKIIINEDSLKAVSEKKTNDSILAEIHKIDSIKTVKVKAKFDAYFQLSELFLYDLNNLDSSLYYLHVFVSSCPDSNLVAKALFAIADIYKNQNKKDDANEIYKRIIADYPNTFFANESRKVLGLTVVDIQVDSADIAYNNIEEAISGNNYQNALTNLKEFLIKYPESLRRAKALYTIGWIYEYTYSNKDSSIAYYKKLKDNYPDSSYTISVMPKLEFYASLEKKPDSTKTIKDTSGISLDSTKLLSDSTILLNDSLKILSDTNFNANDTLNKSPDKKKPDEINNGEEKKDEKKIPENSNPVEGLKPKGNNPNINIY